MTKHVGHRDIPWRFAFEIGDEDERYRRSWTGKKKLVVAEKNIHTSSYDKLNTKFQRLLKTKEACNIS